jgi:hypothetical protein
MWSIATGAVIGLLLTVHGVSHWHVTTLWGSRPQASSWLLGHSAAGVGTVLWVAALFGFLLAGVAAGFHFGWWRQVTILATFVSLATLVLFWDGRLWIGVAVNLGVLISLVWLS